MVPAAQIDEALDLDDLDLPLKSRIVRVFWEPYVDWQGEDSLKVWVILDDATTDAEIVSDEMSQVKPKIRDRLRERGITEFVYIPFARESEYRELFEEQ